MGQGLRFNEGKLRLDLVPHQLKEGAAEVFTFGAKKYGDRNWEKGNPISVPIGSFERHWNAFVKGEDFDQESGLEHLKHCAANIAMIMSTMENYPMYDDRPRKWSKKRRVGIDIDGVIADFKGAYMRWFGLEDEVPHWKFNYHVSKHFDEIKNCQAFWMGIDPLCSGVDMPFEPDVYVTARPIPKEWVEDWLQMFGFPCNKAVTVSGSKVQKLKEFNIDFYIDDKFSNFVELNENGICTFLYDQPWNEKYNVGVRRITSLEEFYLKYM